MNATIEVIVCEECNEKLKSMPYEIYTIAFPDKCEMCGKGIWNEEEESYNAGYSIEVGIKEAFLEILKKMYDIKDKG